MKSTLLPDLVYAAIRIYLTQLQHETEQLLRGYKLRERLAVSQVARKDWNRVVEAGSRVVLYIQNCKYDDQINQFAACGALGLCAIEAAQDALAKALLVAQTCREQHDAASTANEQMVWNHTIRAKYIVNSIVAKRLHDVELATLWETAAQHALLQIQGRKIGDAYTSWDEFSSDITDALRLTASASAQVHLEVANLQLRAARNYRLSFVHSVLGNTNYYHQVAEAFDKTSKYYSKGAQCPTIAAVLWRRASETMVLAAEVMENDARSTVSDLGSAVEDTVRIAKSCAERAEIVTLFLAHLELVDDRVTQWPESLQVRNKLSSMLQSFHQHLQQLVDESVFSYAEDVIDELETNHDNLNTVVSVGDAILLGMERSEFYRMQAVQCNHMWSQCWTRAAECMDEAVRLETQAVLDVQSGEKFSSAQLPGQVERNLAHQFERCASNIIDSAVLYHNRARGVKMSTIDAREEQWWNAATNCCIEAAVQCMEGILLRANWTLSGTQLPAVARREQDKASVYVRAAEYMANARKCSTTTPTCYANISTLAAELTIATLSSERSVHNTLRSTAAFCGSYDSVLGENTEANEKTFAYARSFLAALRRGTKAAVKWKIVLDCYLDAVQQNWSGPLATACVSLYAGAAQQLDAGHKFASDVFTYAANMILDMENQTSESEKTSRYRIELLRRLCNTCKDTCKVPEEVDKLAGMTQEEISENSWLEDHVNACIAEIECTTELSSAAADSAEAKKWQSAQSEARALCYYYMQYTKSRHDDPEDRRHEGANTLVRIALQIRVVQCSIGAARANEYQCVDWGEALTLCRAVRHYAGKYREEGLNVLDHHIAGAVARSAGDYELMELHRKAAIVSRNLCGSMIHRNTTAAINDLKRNLQEVERRIDALLATRKGYTELASLHSQIADMLLELTTTVNLLSSVEKSKEQKEARKVRKREARIEELSAAAAAMAEAL